MFSKVSGWVEQPVSGPSICFLIPFYFLFVDIPYPIKSALFYYIALLIL